MDAKRAMALYKVEKLMEETRHLAVAYRRSTGQTLAVSGEIARYDGLRLLHIKPVNDLQGVDGILDYQGQSIRVQIKGRVIFDESKNIYKLGKINLDTPWQMMLLVLLNADYETDSIYGLTRELIEANEGRQKPFSVAKFKAIGTLLWSRP